MVRLFDNTFKFNAPIMGYSNNKYKTVFFSKNPKNQKSTRIQKH